MCVARRLGLRTDTFSLRNVSKRNFFRENVDVKREITLFYVVRRWRNDSFSVRNFPFWSRACHSVVRRKEEEKGIIKHREGEDTIAANFLPLFLPRRCGHRNLSRLCPFSRLPSLLSFLSAFASFPFARNAEMPYSTIGEKSRVWSPWISNGVDGNRQEDRQNRIHWQPYCFLWIILRSDAVNSRRLTCLYPRSRKWIQRNFHSATTASKTDVEWKEEE